MKTLAMRTNAVGITYFVPVDYEPGSVEVQVLGRTKVITRQCARKLGLID